MGIFFTLGEITAAIVVVVVFFRIGLEFAPVLFRWLASYFRPPAEDERNDE